MDHATPLFRYASHPSAPLTGPDLYYRIYFLDQGGRIEAAQGFRAANDNEARRIFAVLAEACSDVHGRFLLWCGARLVCDASAETINVAAADELDLPLQRCVLRCEETLRHSVFRLARSRKLSARIEALVERGVRRR
jgi:hypothetical protein